MARLRLSRIASAVGLLSASGLAMADPVSLVGLAIAGASAAGAITATTAFLLSAGIGLIGSKVASSQARRKQAAAAAASRASYNASLQDRNVTVLNSEAPWQVVYGNPAPIGGAVVGIFTSGERDQYKHLVVVFASHPCEAIDEVYIDGEPLGTLDSNGDVTAGTFYEGRENGVISELITLDGSGNGVTSRIVSTLAAVVINGEPIVGATAGGTTVSCGAIYAGAAAYVTYGPAEFTARVNVQKHLSPGGVDTSDAYLEARVGSAQWNANDVLSGFTYAVVSLDLDMARFQGGPPNITATLRGKKVYDWRTSTTAYSTNPALCLADFLMSEAGFGAALAQFDSSAVIAAANAADAQALRCDGSFTTDQPREGTKQQLEDAFGGSSHQSGGVWRILPGAWTSPVMALTEADLAAPIQIDQASNPSRERFNTARGTYIDGSGLGVSTDFTPWVNSTHLAADGVARPVDLVLPFTRDHQRTQDLARMRVERSRGGLTVTIPCHMRAWPLQPGDRISVTNAEFGWSAKAFRVTDWGFHPHAPVSLVAVEDSADYYNEAVIVTADATPNTNLPNPFVVDPLTGLVAASGTDQLLIQVDGSVVSRVRLDWTGSTSNLVTTAGKVEIQHRRADTTAAEWQTLQVAGDATSALILGLADGMAYLLRARFVNQLNIPGEWKTIVHVVIGKTAPPASPTRVNLSNELVFFIGVTDADLAGYRIRSLPGQVSAPAFSRGTDVITGLVLASPARIERSLFGLQTVMVVAEDTSGNQSAPAFATFDFGEPDENDPVYVRGYAVESFPGTYTDCALSGGTVLANLDPAANLYALADLYGEPDVYATLYLALTWQAAQLNVPYTGLLTLATTTEGGSVSIEYRVAADTVTDLYASADVYASSSLYGEPSEWAAWPGALAVSRATPLDLRVSIGAGSERGEISAFTATLTMPETAQTFSRITVDAAGTRLTPSTGTPVCNWIGDINAVYGQVVAEAGSTAIAAKVLDYSPTLGPLVQLVDVTGAAVSGRCTFRVEGNSDD